MFSMFTLGLVLAAPAQVQPPAVLTPAQPPAGFSAPIQAVEPRILELRPGPDGKVRVQVLRTEMRKIPVAGAGAGQPPAREIPVTAQAMVELGDIKDLTAYTAGGKDIARADAVLKLDAGGIVVVSGDGKPVDPKFLKLFRDDVLVLVSPELVGPLGRGMPGMPGVLPAAPLVPGGPGGLPVPDKK